MNALARDLANTLAGSLNLRAFLRLIREGESGQDDDAYSVIVGGSKAEDLKDHPRRRVYIASLKVWSTAAGAYQFLSRTWDGCAKALELTSFGPRSQDVAAVYLIRRRNALDDVLAGRVRDAIRKCSLEWASLPGSPYGQPVMSLDKALAVYREWGGVERPDNTPAPIETIHVEPENSMPTPLSILLPLGLELAKYLPTFAKLVKPDSKTAQVNAEVVSKGVEVIQKTLGATSPLEALEIVRSDPASAQQADKAVREEFVTIIEAGGGGIGGARDFLLKAGDGAYGHMVWKIVATVTIAALLFLLLANIMAGAMMGYAIYKGNEAVIASANQFFAQVITADIGAALTAFGFWLGSSWGSKRQEESKAASQ